MRAASRRGLARDDAGLTLLELTVTVGVMLVVLTAAWFLLSTTGANLNRIEYGGQASESNRMALAAFQSDVDQAVSTTLGVSPVIVAQPRTVSFYANVDGDTVPAVVTWTADDTDHVLLRVVTDGSTTTTSSVCASLTDGPSDTMFNYAVDASQGWETSVTPSTVGLVGLRLRNTMGPAATQTLVDRSIWCRVDAYAMNTTAQ